ncbi:hypothetical protein [Streptomyces sp. WAC05374]|uniref:hypothetical protein n=1 Tax=Streptomyces sp. WAC05374 TaxID=2487420 RepID=UPI001F351729|nr:hypothetical protein [Streptomyces sp. WAC05374]
MPSPDTARQEAFADLMVDALNKGALALLTSVGHQTGLFDTMSALPPATSEDIARAADLHERYVREWLGGMVVGGIVEYRPQDATYRLPPEHAASLTTAAGPDNLAGMMPYGLHRRRGWVEGDPLNVHYVATTAETR